MLSSKCGFQHETQLRFSLCFPAIFTPFTCAVCTRNAFAQNQPRWRQSSDHFSNKKWDFLGFHPRADINNTQWHLLHEQNLKKCSDADAGLVLLFSASAFARNQGWNLKRLKNSADAAQARAGFSWTCFLHQLRRSTKVFLCKAQAYNEDCAKADKNHKKLNVYYLQVDFFWSSIKEGIWTTFGAVATQVEL